MLEDIKSNIAKLVAQYEAERQRAELAVKAVAAYAVVSAWANAVAPPVAERAYNLMQQRIFCVSSCARSRLPGIPQNPGSGSRS